MMPNVATAVKTALSPASALVFFGQVVNFVLTIKGLSH